DADNTRDGADGRSLAQEVQDLHTPSRLFAQDRLEGVQQAPDVIRRIAGGGDLKLTIQQRREGEHFGVTRDEICALAALKVFDPVAYSVRDVFWCLPEGGSQ